MSFYGFEAASNEIRSLYLALEHAWSVETCAPRYRAEWSEENKTLGQCSITAFLVQDILGGKVYGVPLEAGGVHCFNEVDSFRFDLTSEQFGDVRLDYENCTEQRREEHFADEDKHFRYVLLKDRLEKYLADKA